jgi:hypothetical protein
MKKSKTASGDFQRLFLLENLASQKLGINHVLIQFSGGLLETSRFKKGQCPQLRGIAFKENPEG